MPQAADAFLIRVNNREAGCRLAFLKEGRKEMISTAGLTEKFRHVRLELAREKGHPTGDREDGYDLLVPLDEKGRIDPAEWKRHQESCWVRRFRRGAEDRIGRLRRKPGGKWYFDYEAGEEDDELGFRLGEERFVPGEYVSIETDGTMHTFKVRAVETP
jgi:hypothetical protein